MSRKDYIALAAIIERHILDLNDAGIALVSDLTDLLEEDNPLFDRDRFVAACVGDDRLNRLKVGKATTYVGLALDQKGRQ